MRPGPARATRPRRCRRPARPWPPPGRRSPGGRAAALRPRRRSAAAHRPRREPGAGGPAGPSPRPRPRRRPPRARRPAAWSGTRHTHRRGRSPRAPRVPAWPRAPTRSRRTGRPGRSSPARAPRPSPTEVQQLVRASAAGSPTYPRELGERVHRPVPAVTVEGVQRATDGYLVAPTLDEQVHELMDHRRAHGRGLGETSDDDGRAGHPGGQARHRLGKGRNAPAPDHDAGQRFPAPDTPWRHPSMKAVDPGER